MIPSVKAGFAARSPLPADGEQSLGAPPERRATRCWVGRTVISESSRTVAGDHDVTRLTKVTRRAGAPLESDGALLPDRAQAAGTLRRLYETALLLFGNRGFHAVSVRDLTRELGMQASSLYA